MTPKLTTEADIRIGARVRAARERAGMSQTELGRVLGVSFQQVQKYENASNRLSAARIQIIADYYDIPVAEFYRTSAPVVVKRSLTVREAEEALLAAAADLAEARAREAAAVLMEAA
jgi:transcriptional regulator with XRE-family HTH domain